MEVENPETDASGKVQANATGTGAGNWFKLEERDGVAGIDRDSGEAGAAQHTRLQWQEALATRLTQAAGAEAGTTGVHASDRLQTMASIVFTF